MRLSLEKENIVKSLLALLAFFAATRAYALQPGDAVPNLALPSTTGESIRLTDFSGSWIVLYFYPRAFTPGCTAQSCSLRDEFGELQQRGAVILGASLDSPEKQSRFQQEHRLPFELLSDENGALARAFDSLMWFRRMAQRKTFIIAPNGTVAYRFDRPHTTDHADEVISKLDELIRATL